MWAGVRAQQASPAAGHIHKRRFARVDSADRTPPAFVFGYAVVTNLAEVFVNFENNVCAGSAVGHESLPDRWILCD
jgi:hypothetical protein